MMASGHGSFSWRLLEVIALLATSCAGVAPVQAATFYVKPGGTGDGSSWANARGSIQSTLNASASGDEIWVASGTYNEALSLKESRALYGGFLGTENEREHRDWTANPTIIDATGLNRSVVTASNIPSATLDGFTVTNGRAGVAGGGVYCHSSSPTLTSCTITGNSTNLHGGGVYCDFSSPTLNNCTLCGNTAVWGGGIACVSASPTLISCAISDNAANLGGGGLYCTHFSLPTLRNCTISGNSS